MQNDLLYIISCVKFLDIFIQNSNMYILNSKYFVISYNVVPGIIYINQTLLPFDLITYPWLPNWRRKKNWNFQYWRKMIRIWNEGFINIKVGLYVSYKVTTNLESHVLYYTHTPVYIFNFHLTGISVTKISIDSPSTRAETTAPLFNAKRICQRKPQRERERSRKTRVTA